MKGLGQFEVFNWEGFAKGKTFIVTAIDEWKDFETKKHLGWKVECVISEDNTSYAFKDGKTFSNRFEKIAFKLSKKMSIPLDSKIIPKGVVASIYGQYRNQLSLKCDDIEILKS